MFELLRVYFSELNVASICLRIVLSMLIGGILGVERGFKNRPAGFRTYILVCMGSTIIMTTNQYLYLTYPNTDIARLGAQVVSGIGFLGAGTIIVTKKSQIRGLTTAAGLWVAAALGLAIGIGFYEGAMIGGLGIFFVMTVLHKLDNSIRKRSTVMNLYIEYDSPFSIRDVLEYLQTEQSEVFDMQLTKGKTWKDTNAILFTVSFSTHIKHAIIIEKIGSIDGVQYVEEIW